MSTYDEYNNAIEEDRLQLRALTAAMDDIVFEISADKRFLNVWTRDESLLFMPKDLFIGKTITEVMGPLAERFNQLTDEILQTGEVREFKYSHLDPSIRHYYKAKGVVINKEDAPEQHKLAISVKDITQQTLQEQELKETAEKLANIRGILDHSQQLSQTGGWAYRLETNEVYWTKSTYEIYDVHPDTEITYELALSLYTDEDNAILNKLVEDAIKNGTSYEKILQAKNGKWIHVMGEPIYEDNKIVALSGAVKDITQKLNDERELIEAKEAAEIAASTKMDFLSVMSHEIRTPLNGIIGIANLLGLTKTAEQEELVNSLIFSANHLQRLVNDILDLNKINSEKLTLIKEDFSLVEMLYGATRQFLSITEAKGIKLKTKYDSTLPERISADAVRLGQVLNNLLNNAIKFTDEGRVTLNIERVEQTDTAPELIKFTVTDTGIGISEKDQKRVFEPFEQVTQDSTRKQTGTGLGLQISQKLVAMMGGELLLESEVGKGSTFYFSIPLEEPQADDDTAAQDQLAQEQSKEDFSGIRLLLAEDNPVNTLVASKQLEHFGIKPVCAADGKAALAHAHLQDFDVALIDLHMPEMDGFELSAKIRKEFPDIHIVIFTADITDEAKERIYNLNVHYIISKPFVPKEMHNILMKVWAEKKALE